MDLFNLAPLTQRRGKGAYGGHEWKSINNSLLSDEGRRLGVVFFPIDDSNKDLYKIADGYSPGGLVFPGKNYGGEAFQYHFCGSPIPVAARRAFNGKIERLAKLKSHPVRVIILLTPENPEPPDVEWIIKLGKKYSPLRIAHWGHTYFVGLLSHHPNLLNRVFPEVIVADLPAMSHLESMKESFIRPLSDQCRDLINKYTVPNYVVDITPIPKNGPKGKIFQEPQSSRVNIFTMNIIPDEFSKSLLYSDLENHYPGLLHNLEIAYKVQREMAEVAENGIAMVMDKLRRKLNLKEHSLSDREPPWASYESLARFIFSWALWPIWPNQYIRHDEERNEVIANIGGATMAKGLRDDCLAVTRAADEVTEDQSIKDAAKTLAESMNSQSQLLLGVYNTTQEILLTQRLVGRCMYS